MKLSLLLLIATCAIVSFADAMVPLREKAYYSLIISREPFGKNATLEELATETPPEQDPVKVQEESNKIQLCAMTITPDGRTAVGLIDNGIQPPAYLTLFDGDSSNGLELLISDLDEEFATFRRDGITFTLGLGLGLIETITPELLKQRKAEEEDALAAEEERERRRPNSLAEQLIAMQMSLPPDMEAPPLPIPLGDVEMFTREFDPDKERGEPQTETEAIIQAGVSEMKEAIATGESPQEYLQRLVEHRQKEVERQKEEKNAAKKALEETLASGNYTADDEVFLRRRANIELMKKGVRPLSPVDDLTESEQSEINAALNAMEE